MIFLGRVSDAFEWKSHLSRSNVSSISDDAPVIDGVSPKQAFRETKVAKGKAPFVIWYLYTRDGRPVLRGPTNESAANKLFLVSAELNERSLVRYEAAEETIKQRAKAEAAAEAEEKKRQEEENKAEMRKIEAEIAKMEKDASAAAAAADKAAMEVDAKALEAEAKALAEAEEAEATALAAEKAAEEEVERKKVEREAAMADQIIAKIEEARGKIETQLLTVTGIKAGDSAATRIDKVNDAMDKVSHDRTSLSSIRLPSHAQATRSVPNRVYDRIDP